MPAAGNIVVKISPFEAAAVARWLRTRPAPLMGVPRINRPTLPNGTRLDIVERLEAIASRKRNKSPSAMVDVEMDRDDVLRLKGIGNTGMFASRPDPTTPIEVRTFACRCGMVLMRHRGRRRLFGRDLDQAIQRQTNAVSDGADDRYLKRLRKEKRRQDQLRAGADGLTALLEIATGRRPTPFATSDVGIERHSPENLP